MASRIEWHKVKPATLRGELIELVIALALIAVGWLSLPTLLLAVLAELLVTAALSWYFYPQRGLRRHLADIAKMFGLLCFLAIFILAAYAGAGGFVERPASRPITKFEQRGLNLGHGVRDLLYRRA